jgi:hypothetical protein
MKCGKQFCQLVAKENMLFEVVFGGAKLVHFISVTIVHKVYQKR